MPSCAGSAGCGQRPPRYRGIGPAAGVWSHALQHGHGHPIRSPASPGPPRAAAHLPRCRAGGLVRVRRAVHDPAVAASGPIPALPAAPRFVRETRQATDPPSRPTVGGLSGRRRKALAGIDDKAGTAIAERNVVPIDRSADLAAAGSFRVRRGGWRTAPAAIAPLSRCGSAARPSPLPARPSALRLPFSRGCHAQGRTKLSSDATRRQRVTFAAVGQMERLVSQKSTSLARCGLKAGQ